MRIFSSAGRGPSGGHDLGPDEVSARVVEVVEEALHCGGGGRKLGDPGQYSTVQVYRTGHLLPRCPRGQGDGEHDTLRHDLLK